MASIKGIEKIKSVIGNWNPRDLAIIEGIELKSDVGMTVSALEIRALFQPRTDSWPNFDKEMYRVVIVFDGVRGLRLKDFGGGAVQIMGFDIHFVGDRGLESISYEIEDYEDDRIRFSCGGIEILSVKPAIDEA